MWLNSQSDSKIGFGESERREVCAYFNTEQRGGDLLQLMGMAGAFIMNYWQRAFFHLREIAQTKR